MTTRYVPPKAPETSAVGRSIERQDIRAKLTGEAVYLADIPSEDCLHVKLLRTPVAHARL